MAEHDNTIVQSPIELNGLSKYLSLVFHRSLERAIWAFCELGIADLMADHQGPITASTLSQLNGNNWNAEFLYRLLRVIADAGIVKELNSTATDSRKDSHPEETIEFQLTDDGQLLTSGHFSKARDMIRIEFSPNAEKTTTYLPSLIKSGYANGNSFEQAFGCNLFEYMQKEENKEYTSLFNNSMVTYSNCVTAPLLAVVDFSHCKTLVDIAGGLGTLLSSILEKHRNLHGILFDLDHVIESAKAIRPNEFEQRQIESNRFDFVAGDMFKSETIPLADAYTLKFIIHDWNDEKSIEILKSIRSANRTQTITVFIVETVILSNAKENWEAHVMDLEMLSGLGAKERSLSQYISLLNESGYELKQLYKTNSFMSIIEAVTKVDNCH